MKILFDEYGKLLLYALVLIFALGLFSKLELINQNIANIEETYKLTLKKEPVTYITYD